MMKNRGQRTTNKGQQGNRRTFGIIFYVLIGLMFLLFIARFSQIALLKRVNHVDLKSRAGKLYTQQQVINAKRGTIYDANGDALAQNTSTYTVYAVLDHRQKGQDGKKLYVTNKAQAARVLAAYLPIDEEKAYQTMTPKKKSFQVEFGNAGRNISIETMRKIKAKHVNGLHFLATPARQYPEGEFATQLVGLASPHVNDKTGQTTLVGQLGIEAYFDKQLRGKNGFRRAKQDVYGYRLSKQDSGWDAKDGDNIHLTLDSQIQQLLENKLQSVEKETHASSMAGVVMEAKTGKVIAATQRPDRNSSTPVWRNTLVQDTFEPGSTMKVLSLSAAIDSGHFDPNATYNSGSWSIGGGKITDWVTSGWGAITYRDAFYRSSNVGFAHIEQNMGSKNWMKYIKRFHLLQPVRVWGMGGETPGYTSFKGILMQANTAYGQGITTNIMQMMQAFSAIANNGKMMKPYVVSRVTDANNQKTVAKTGPQVVGNPIKASTAKQVRKLMVGVITDKNGTGQAYKIPGKTIAVKTGTAQIGTSHGYETGDSNYVYSVVGMAPAKEPKYIIYIIMKQPKTLKQPAETELANVFKPVTSSLLDRTAAKKGSQGVITLADYQGRLANSIQSELGAKHLQVTVLGNGKHVTAQSVPAGRKVMVNSRLILKTSGNITMPSLQGWSQADVNRLGKLAGIRVESNGNGYVTKQSIAKGTTIKKDQILKIECKAH